MKKKIILYTILVSSLFFSICCTNTRSESPLIGSWEMKRVDWISKDTTYTIENAQPGILLVNKNRYAIIWTPIKEKRKSFKILSKPTDEEIINGFRSIVFNSGNYETTDSTFVTTAEIAKVPGFEGGKQFYTYTIEDSKLELTFYDETYPSGKKPDWFGIWKTKFIFNKVENK